MGADRSGDRCRRQILAAVAWSAWHRRLPIRQSTARMERDENVRWKVEIPGRGSASPVVWGDRLFVLTAVPVGVTGDQQHAPRGGVQPRIAHRFVVMAIDRKTGRTVWERVAREEEPHEAGHPENSTWASSSAITDGEHVFALLRIARTVRLRHGRQAAVADRFRRQAHAESVRRGIDARALSKHARDRLGPHRRAVVRRRARQARRARSCGGCRGRKSTPGPRRSWSR